MGFDKFFFSNKKTSKCFSEIHIDKKDHNIAWVGNNCINILIVEFRCLIYGVIHKRRRNILGGEGCLKLRHGGGGYQKRPQKFRRLLWTVPMFVHYVEVGMLPTVYILGQ